MPIRLSDRSTLLVPVAHDALAIPATVRLGDVELVRKSEHHITVFGFDIGKLLGAAIAKTPALRAAADALAEAADFGWTMPSPPTLWRLHRDRPRDLQTVIAMVDAPGIAAFFAACARELPALSPGIETWAWDPPPPHITLYTSDPAGKDGIGLRRASELEQALARGAAGETTGLRAFAAALPEVTP